MPDIYSSAKGVIVWLGPESDNSALAMKAIQDLGPRIIVDWNLFTVAAASERDLELNLYSREFFNEVEPSQPVWRSIECLLNRAWFQRLWVIQEIYLGGKRAHVVCGFVKVSYKDFSNAVYYLRTWSGWRDPQIWNMVFKILHISNSRTLHSLRWILDRTRSSECSDLRDKVYAILSRVTEHRRLDIRPYYTISVPEVFEKVVLQEVKCLSSLNSLQYCSMEDRGMDIPTWVPDWSISSDTIALSEFLRASADAKAHSRSESQGILVATGVCVIEVDKVMDVLPTGIPEDRYESGEVIGKLVSALVGGEPNHSNVDRLHALSRTLCVNHFSERFIPANSDCPRLEEAVKYVSDYNKWSR